MGKPVKFSDKKKPWYRPSLPRAVRTRPQRERILIVCEGERTEPNYFQSIGETLPREVVHVEIEGTGLNTITLIRKAIELRDARADGDYPYDQAWAVFDKDDFPADDFDNAVNMSQAHNIKAAYSNQAFELWYVLHFEDRDTGMHRSEYKDCLTGHLGERYEKNDQNMYAKVATKGSEQNAISRARRLRSHASSPPSSANPSTTVFELVETLNRFKR